MKKFIAAALAASLVSAAVPSTASAYVHKKVVVPPTAHSGSSVVPWLVIGCAGGIIAAAFAANFVFNRELTAQEAWTCGMLYWFNQATGQWVRVR